MVDSWGAVGLLTNNDTPSAWLKTSGAAAAFSGRDLVARYGVGEGDRRLRTSQRASGVASAENREVDNATMAIHTSAATHAPRLALPSTARSMMFGRVFLVLTGACQFGHGVGGVAINSIHSVGGRWPGYNIPGTRALPIRVLVKNKIGWGARAFVMIPARPYIGQGSRGFERARGGSGSGCPC